MNREVISWLNWTNPFQAAPRAVSRPASGQPFAAAAQPQPGDAVGERVHRFAQILGIFIRRRCSCSWRCLKVVCSPGAWANTARSSSWTLASPACGVLGPLGHTGWLRCAIRGRCHLPCQSSILPPFIQARGRLALGDGLRARGVKCFGERWHWSSRRSPQVHTARHCANKALPRTRQA